jgi:hypothetical protein
MWWGGDVSEEEQEQEQEQDVPEVSPAFQRCVSDIKWRLYETVVFGPELATPEAQENGLIQTYVQQLETLYRLLDAALRGAFKESDLAALPPARRHEVLQCVHALQKVVKGAQNAAELIPYREYLQEMLRVYPFVHARE